MASMTSNSPLKTANFELRYFPLMAKGLGPSLVLEHSGLDWNGNASLPFSTSTDWKEMKPKTPFGQLPLLTTVQEEGTPPFHIAQTAAIINFVGKVSGMEGENEFDFAFSQQLLLEGEDIYNLMVRYVPTLYKRLSSPGVSTSKGNREDYDKFFDQVLPKHLAQVQTLLRTFSKQMFFTPHREGKFLPGELYLFAVIHQAALVKDLNLSQYPNLHAWYTATLNSESTQKVLKGESKMGQLNQYFQADDSEDVCKVADERS